MIGKKVCGSGGWGRAGGAIEERLPHLGGGLPAAAEPSADLLDAQLANAEADRLDALEEAENASEDCDGYRREANRLRHLVRDLEEQLRVEKHEHAETRARLAKAERERELPDLVTALLTGARLRSEPPPSPDYDLNHTAAQLSRLEPR